MPGDTHLNPGLKAFLILGSGSPLLKTLHAQQFAVAGGMDGGDIIPRGIGAAIIVVDIIIHGAQLIPTRSVRQPFIFLI